MSPKPFWRPRKNTVAPEPVAVVTKFEPLPPRKIPNSVSWFIHDLAKGGVSRYTLTMLEALATADSKLKPHMIVIGTGYQFDADLAHAVSKFCKLVGTDTHVDNSANYRKYDWIEHRPGPSAYQEAIDTSSVLTVAGLNEKYTPLPAGVKFDGIKCVGQIHGVCPWTQDMIRYCQHFCSRFMAVSTPARDIAPPLITKPELLDIPVIDAGLDMNRLIAWKDLRTTRLELIKRGSHALDLPTHTLLEAPWVLYFGRFATEKRIPLVAQVISRMIERAKVADLPVPSWELGRLTNTVGLFCGDGWNFASDSNMVRQALPHRSVIVPWTPAREMGNVLATSDACIVMSEYEGGPLTAIEAISAGVPTLSTPVGFMPTLQIPLSSGGCRLAFTPLAIHESIDSMAEKLAITLAARKTGVRLLEDYESSRYTTRRFNMHRFAADWESLLA